MQPAAAILPSEGFRLDLFEPADGGFAYTLLPTDYDYRTNSYELYASAVAEDPTLYLWDPVSGRTEKYPLPDGVIPAPGFGLADGVLFMQKLKKNSDPYNPQAAFGAWIAWQLETGEVWEVSP